MELITHYESSDGTSTPIAEMNNFHLLNALLKANFAGQLEICNALKAEVFKRMDNRPNQGQEYRADCAMCDAQKKGVFVPPHVHETH